MIKYLRVEQIINYHFELIENYGGLHGIRDIRLLESAMSMPRATAFGKDIHETIYDKASAYLFHMVKNHPFNDGNKRIGAFSSCVFLRSNGVDFQFIDEEYECLVIKVASGNIDKIEIAQFFESSSKDSRK